MAKMIKIRPKPRTYSSYPCGIILVSSIFSLAAYLLGAFIISKIGLFWLGLYIVYVAWLEIRVMSKSCVNCYYYGKYCAFGKGKISSWLFKKGSSERFHEDKISWKDLLPDFLAPIIPVIAGIILLILGFDWLILASVVLLLILTTMGNGFVRGSLACKFCRQRELGCSAEQLFRKKKK